MKRTNIMILLVAAAMAVPSCKFLDLEPVSSYTVDMSYKRQSDFEFAIAGVYDAQQALYARADCWLRATILRSDEVRAGQGGSTCKGLSSCTNDANVQCLATAWQYFWQVISRANTILTKIDAAEFQSEEVRRQIKGEALALRAWSYYNLAWQFGGMPLIDKAINLKQTFTVPRSTQEETLNFAANDYRVAIGLLPEEWFGTNKGRITKYAAMGGLARLYMFRSDYPAAKYYLEQIIASGRYKMEEKYVNCFTDSHDNGMERLWEVQFTGGIKGEGTEFPTGLLPENYNKNSVSDGSMLIPFNGYATAVPISLDMIAAYEPGDIRKTVSTVQNLNIGGITETVYSYMIKYIHYDDYTPQLKTDWACNLPIMRYTDVLMLYAECLNEEGYSSGGQAFTILNDVRRRAGLAAKTAADLPDQESFRQALRAERRVEFAFEGLRWQDIVRWNIAEDVMNEHFRQRDNGSSQFVMEGKWQRIFAIPFTEMSRYNDDSIMWQNPGY